MLTHAKKIWSVAKYFVLAGFFALGISGIIQSYNLARDGVSLYNVSGLFWVSYFALTLPFIIVIIGPDSKFWSRITSLIAFGAATSFPKIFRSLEGPIYSDEFGHLRAVEEILESGSLNWWNSIVNPVTDFSVLHYFTAFIVESSGLELWHAANILIIIFHTLTLMGLFSLLRVKFSPRAAAVGSLIYAANPNWLFFHSRFAYETLAILIMLWVLFFIIRGLESPAGQRALMIVLSGPMLFVLSQTHHITFVTALGLILIYLVILCLKEYKTDILKVWTAGIATVWLTLWSLPSLISNSNILGNYISYTLAKPTRSNIPFLLETLGLSTSDAISDDIAYLDAYATLPFYEQTAGIISPIILALVLSYFWISEVRIHGSLVKAFKNQTTLSLFANVLTIAYFALLPLIFSGEYTLVRRSWTYLLIGFAILFAIFYERYLLSVPKSMRGRPPKWKQLNVVILLSFMILSISSLANGATASQRYPIPDGQIGFSSSKNLNPELQQLASWAKNTLPKNSWVLTDRYTRNALVYPGGLNVAPMDTERFPYWNIFLNPSDPPEQVMKSAETLGVDYIVLNRYLFAAPTAYGYWFHPDETLSYGESEFGLYEVNITEAFNLSDWTETVWASETYVVYKVLWSQYEPAFAGSGE